VVQLDCSGPTVVVEIEDNGPAIPSEELEVLERARETSLKHGSGIGLWIVDWVIEKASGEVIFETTDVGNLVRVTLPKEQAE
jgi:signal transduction histidine kinase